MPKTRWIIGLLVLFYLVRLLLIAWLELAPDESYYWYWAKHLDWSYYDHPPMIAYIMALFTGLIGDNEFSVRIGGLLLSLLVILLLYRSCRRLSPDDPTAPWNAIFMANITLLFSAGCIIQTPDTPLLFFWATAVYCGIELITDGSPRWWYLWGVALGLGLLSKYTMILIVPCQFAFLLLSGNHRHWLFRKEPYLALLIGLALFSPVVIWNWQHDWVSFAFHLQRGFEPDQKSALIKLMEYLGGQAGIVTPLLFVVFVFYSAKALRMYRRLCAPEYLYLLLLSWPVILFFGYASLRGAVAQPNWPAPAYIAGLLLLALIYSRYYREKKSHRIFLVAAASLALLANVLIHTHLISPFLPISPQIDTTQQFHGWRALGQAVNRHIQENPHPSGYFLLADRGTTVAGALFYTGKSYIGIDFSRPERYTFLQRLEELKGKNAILLLHHVSDSDLQFYRPYFRELQVLGKQTARFRGEDIGEYSVYLVLGKEYRGNWQPSITRVKAS
jgi:4-amino-4-deoxy-L-arabinose transferase-like glycosyltransferase